MSTPPFLRLPPCARALPLSTERGVFAALEAVPASGAEPRGTAVLVPGFTGSKEDFIALLAPLSSRGYRVVCFDQRGQYQTPGPDNAAAYSCQARTDDLAAVVRAVSAPPVGAAPHLVGHSYGGLVARALVLRSDLPRPSSLTLMSSGPAAICDAEAARLRMLESVLPVMDREQVWQAVRQAGGEDAGVSVPGPEIAEFLHRRWLGNTPAATAAMAEQLRTEPDRTAELAVVVGDGLPVLVVSGDDDYAWPVPWQSAAARRLGVKHVVVGGAGHSPAVDDPHTTAAALADFWDAVH